MRPSARAASLRAIVECRERDPLSGLALQVQEARELDSISRTQRVPEQQLLGIEAQLGGQFYKETGREIGIEPLRSAITLGHCEGTLAFAAGEC
jgi:hypothetical protein